MTQKLTEKKLHKAEYGLYKGINIASLFIAILGVVTSIKMNLVGRSLWFDEAALAYSFSQRGLTDLTASELEKIQSAPVAWLYLVKVFTLIFGNTDFVLRVPAILAYVGILFLTYYIMKQIFVVNCPMMAVAFAASMPLLLQYSNVFKPYIFDGLCALLVLTSYWCYENGKWKLWQISLLWMLLIWFSNPSAFVEGACIVTYGLFALFEKNWKKIRELVFITLAILVSFVVDYFYWLKQTATSGSMQGFWADWKFPLLIRSKADFVQLVKMLATLFAPFYRVRFLFAALLVLILIFALWKKEKFLLSMYLSLFVAAFASALSMFPVNKRLWLFMYPIVIVIIYGGMYEIIACLNVGGENASGEYDSQENVDGENVSAAINPETGKKIKVMDSSGKAMKLKCVLANVVLLAGFFIALWNGGIRYYWQDENVYWPGYEAKGEYEYLLSVVTEEDGVYIYNSAEPMFDYYNHYNFETLADTGIPIKVGTVALAEGWDCEEDLDYIFSQDRCYVFMSDSWDVETSAGKLFTEAEKYGRLEMVYFEHETPLFLFTKTER